VSRSGSVCEKHQEYSPDGVCRWCEPPLLLSAFMNNTKQTTKMLISPCLCACGKYMCTPLVPGWLSFQGGIEQHHRPGGCGP